jgi:hypothetical protein
MESAEHLALTLGVQTRGIQILLWEHKTELVRALIVLKAGLQDFPEAPILLPTEQKDLLRFSIGLFENSEEPPLRERRIILVPQASTGTVGSWLNGWRRQLANPPGTLFVIRRADFLALYRRAPDLMSFAQSEIHETTDMMPLIDQDILIRISGKLPDAWNEPLNALPGVMPSEQAILNWVEHLKSNSQ